MLLYINSGGFILKKLKIWLNTVTLILFILSIVFISLLPLYYKLIWPPIIGIPARAETVDVLAFWGAFFSGILTLVGVLITVRFTQREMKESNKQHQREKFIKSFGSTILEINSILSEIGKFKEYIIKFKNNIPKYRETGLFDEIIVQFDTKEDYKKIKDDKKPDLEIIIKRLEGKAAHADGFVYYQINQLSKEIKRLQIELHSLIDKLSDPNDKNNYEKELQSIFEGINESLEKYESNLKKYKEKLGDNFIEYSRKEGYVLND